MGVIQFSSRSTHGQAFRIVSLISIITINTLYFGSFPILISFLPDIGSASHQGEGNEDSVLHVVSQIRGETSNDWISRVFKVGLGNNVLLPTCAMKVSR